MKNLDYKIGLPDYIARQIAKDVGLKGPEILSFAKILQTIFSILKKYDVTLVDVNPLAITREGSFFALDAKITLDDNASFLYHM